MTSASTAPELAPDHRPHEGPAPSRAASLRFVNLHYAPDVASTGQHLTDLAEWLADAGHEVEVWCARGSYDGGELDAPAREVRNGVRVRRFWTPGAGRRTLAHRVLEYATFLAQALGRAGVDGGPDLTVYLTTPSHLPAVGWLVDRVRDHRYGIWSMDRHPEFEAAVGVYSEDGALARGLRALSTSAYRGAEFVVDLGPAMKRRLTDRGLDGERLTTIPVWNREDEVRPVPRGESSYRDAWGLGDAFAVMYSGNAGLGHRFDVVLRAARRLEERGERVEFLFVGGGPRREEIEAEADRLGLRRFQYRDYVPRHRLDESLSVGDVHLLTLRREAAGLAAPGKLYGIMAAGRPVVMVGPRASDPGAVIEEHGVGTIVEPDAADPAVRLAEELLALRDDDARRRGLGERARRVFERRFAREACCRQWEALVGRTLADDG